jgi:hypothetical protein
MVIACEFRRRSASHNIAIRVTRPPSRSTFDGIGCPRALEQHVASLGEKGKPLMLLDHLTDPAQLFTTMAAQPNTVFASSPAVAVPLAQPDQYFANSHHVDTTMNGLSTPNGSIPPTPGSLAGRKRSRGDITNFDEDEEDLQDGSVATPLDGEPIIPRGKPVYGPGMTLIYPEDPGYAAAAASQSGTWVEEQATRKPFQLAHMKRPSFSSRKSQRKDASAAGADDLAQLVLPPQIREAAAEPLIDEATRTLGISWTRMDSSEALQINKAAYSKWIQNHYPGLKDVAVWFENSALPGYLVEARNAYSAQQEFYIFSHDLTEARLVTTEAAQLVPRLKLLPALHLAAPGGHIRAESDPITAAQNEINGVRMAAAAAATANGMSKFSHEVSQLRSQTQNAMLPSPESMCSAHQMELD